ncbi:hypothetical protein NEOLI_004300 [Neolecta irregularis DAH-3]|uniref:Uncharacterized protein n=1 Tax=Neolecta irregularis (strain DAH-3) TaxID=1198029 RepID=A0A1U7LSJ3_NEOID|nr:hypothetical protein NEOLI_004300 [Neolecta irregularis DAH-3]|eukprot:OLL25646.1 hypothetical protein NEOLI_004300 [Neolecta irregularis DAH-3]
MLALISFVMWFLSVAPVPFEDKQSLALESAKGYSQVATFLSPRRSPVLLIKFKHPLEDGEEVSDEYWDSVLQGKIQAHSARTIPVDTRTNTQNGIKRTGSPSYHTPASSKNQ